MMSLLEKEREREHPIIKGMGSQTTGIEYPHDNDVLSGRGNFANAHPGNKQFRTYINKQKENYAATIKSDKPLFAKLIVNTIRNLVPSGRFLIQDKDTKLWSDIGDKKAWRKVRQALREKLQPAIGDKINPIIISPAEESLLEKPGTQSSTIASSSAMKVRSILLRQMSVAASHRSSDPCLSESLACNNDGNMMSDKNIPESGVPQASSDPPTTLWGTEDISRLSLNDEEHDKSKSLVIADDDKEINDGGNESEDRAISIRDPSGRPVPLRRSFTQKPDRSNLKPNPKYSEASIGTMSSTGLSNLTGLTNFTNFSSIGGISYDTENVTSCSSYLAPKTNTGNGIDPNGFNNSLFFEGQMLENAAALDTESTLSQGNILPKAKIGPNTNQGDDIDPDVFGNSLYLEGQILENVTVLDTLSTVSRRNIAPKINPGHDVDSIGFKHTSLHLDGQSAETYPKFDRLIPDKQISGPTCVLSVSASLLLTPFIGKCEEDNYNNEENGGLEDASLFSMRTDEMMSTQSRRSKKNSMHNSLDDLSHLSGHMSICEHMSIADSGIFSMTETEVHDWHKEANKWEEEVAKLEDDLSMEKEM